MAQPYVVALSVRRPIGVNMLRRPNASIVRSMPNRRRPRGFEQKAAKETKGIGLGFCDGHPVGHSATLRFFYRPRGLNGAAAFVGEADEIAGQLGPFPFPIVLVVVLILKFSQPE
jgi:hypothetical protein